MFGNPNVGGINLSLPFGRIHAWGSHLLVPMAHVLGERRPEMLGGLGEPTPFEVWSGGGHPSPDSSLDRSRRHGPHADHRLELEGDTFLPCGSLQMQSPEG